MPEPILAHKSSWFAPNVSSVKRANITEIEIMDSYTPTGTVTDTWDASAAKDGGVTCYVIGTKLIIAGNGSGKIYANEISDDAFADANHADYFSNLTTIVGFNIFDTRYSRSLQRLFYNCTKLLTVDVSSMDFSSAETLFAMFLFCNKINNLDVSRWDVSNVQSLQRIFMDCKALTSIDVSNWDVSNATNLGTVFSNCENLETINVSKWDTSKCTDFNGMFGGCKKLKQIDISNFTFESVTKETGFTSMFLNCKAIKTIDFTNVKFPQNQKGKFIGASMFNGCTNLEEVKGFDISIFSIVNTIFTGCSSLKTIDVSNWDLSACTAIPYMFQDCTSLVDLDVSNWDLSACTDMTSLFSGCASLANLDVSKWNTSACTNMSFMFYNCSSLGEIDVSNWDTSKVTNLDHFAAHANLKRKGMEKWNTSSLVNANAAFHNCAEEELDLSKWDVSKVQFFCQMFENSPNLKQVKGLYNWNTSSGLGFDGMFERCYKLEEVDLSSFDTTKAKNGVAASTNGHKTATMNNMFLTCNSLKKVTVGPNWSVNGNGTNTTAANKAILPTPSATYIPGADGNWYTFNGDQYAPNAMKDRTAATYYASRTAVYDADVIVKNGSLIDTAKAIREKNGTTTQYTPSEFGAAIRALA